MKKTVIALALVALALPLVAQKQAPPAPGAPRPFNLPQPREFTLANGMEVTLVQWGTVPKARVELAVRTGNIDEDANEVWLADLTGDLMEEGTATRTATQIAQEAARMGGSVELIVGADATEIAGDVLSENADDVVGLIADIVRNPRFPESELARLKGDRLRMLSIARTQPQQLAQEKFRQTLYPNHPYGRLFPTETMLQGYTLDQIRNFYAENFGAARSHIYVAGMFDEAAVEAAIRQAFDGWAAGPAMAPRPPQPVTARSFSLVERPGAVQSTIYVGIPTANPSHQDWVTLQVMNTMLGGYFSSRMTANLREQKGYTYSPFSQLSSRPGDAYWVQVADVTTNVTGPSLKEIFYEIDRLQDQPPSAEELRATQNYMAGSFTLQNSTRTGIINQLQFLEMHGLEPEYLRNYVQRVYQVTPQDVQLMAQRHLDDQKMAVVVVGDRAQIAEQVRPYERPVRAKQ